MFKRKPKAPDNSLPNRRTRARVDPTARTEASGGSRRTASTRGSNSRFTRSKTLSSYGSATGRGRENEDSEQSERQRIHRVKARQKRGVAILGVLLGVTLVVGVALFNFTSKVTTSAVSTQSNIGNSTNNKAYEEIITQYLGSHPSSRFRFTLDLKDMSAYLTSKAPEVKYIKRASFNGIGISNYDLVFRQPILKWQAGQDTYYVDEDGISFQVNLFAEPAIELRDSSLAGGVVDEGGVKISRRILEFAGRLIGAIQQQGNEVEYLFLPPDTTRQIGVKLKSRPTEFIFSIDHSVAGQVDAMRQTITYLDQAGSQPGRVDLRVPDRAYYQ